MPSLVLLHQAATCLHQPHLPILLRHAGADAQPHCRAALMADGMLERGLIAPDGEQWWNLDAAVTVPLLCAMARCVLCVIDIQVPQEMVDDRLVNGAMLLLPVPHTKPKTGMVLSLLPIHRSDRSIPKLGWDHHITTRPQSKHIPKRLRSFLPSISGLMFG